MERKPKHTGLFPSAESWNAQGAYAQTLGQFEDALYCYEQSLSIDQDYHLAKRNKELVIRLLKAEGLYQENPLNDIENEFQDIMIQDIINQQETNLEFLDIIKEEKKKDEIHRGSGMKTCPGCGKSVQAGNKYCYKCGYQFTR